MNSKAQTMSVFHGSIPALVTPFKDGAVDEAAFCAHVERVIAAGSHAVVPCGTTGETPTLEYDETERVIAMCIEVAAGRVPVIAGAGSNNTDRAVNLTRHAKAVGAHAALSATPYYNKPSQDGLYAHYRAIADAVELPVFIYNIPGRSVVDMSVETMARLAEHPNIVGVKDATGDLARVSRQRAECGPDFIQLSGEDATALGFNAHGGVGCISVTANVAPALCAAFQDATLSGRYDEALAIQDRLMPLHDALFSAPNPGPTKHALARLGHMEPDVRLPLIPIPEAAKRAVDAALVHAGLLETA